MLRHVDTHQYINPCVEVCMQKKHITLIKSFRTPTFCRRMPFQKHLSILRVRIITLHVYITEVAYLYITTFFPFST